MCMCWILILSSRVILKKKKKKKLTCFPILHAIPWWEVVPQGLYCLVGRQDGGSSTTEVDSSFQYVSDLKQRFVSIKHFDKRKLGFLEKEKKKSRIITGRFSERVPNTFAMIGYVVDESQILFHSPWPLSNLHILDWVACLRIHSSSSSSISSTRERERERERKKEMKS